MKQLKNPTDPKIVSAKDEAIYKLGEWAPINLATITALAANKLNRTELCVYLSLSCLYNIDKGYAFPSKQTIADNLNCSLSAVKKAIKKLGRLGFISEQIRKDNFGGNLSNSYIPVALAEDYKTSVAWFNPDAKSVKSFSDGGAELDPQGVHDGAHPLFDMEPQLEELLQEGDNFLTITNSISSKSEYPSSLEEWKQIVFDAERYQIAFEKLPKRNAIHDLIKGIVPPKLDLPQPDPDLVAYCQLNLAIFSHNITNYNCTLNNDALVFYSLDQYEQTWVQAIYNYILHINNSMFNINVSNWKLSKKDIDNCLLLKERFGTGFHGWDSSVDFINKITENALKFEMNKSLGTSYFCKNLFKHFNQFISTAEV